MAGTDTDSEARVAFDLYQSLRGHLSEPAQAKAAIEQQLTLFSICRYVVRTGNVEVGPLRG